MEWEDCTVYFTVSSGERNGGEKELVAFSRVWLLMAEPHQIPMWHVPAQLRILRYLI